VTFGPGRLELAIARVEALADATAREAAREAVTAVLDFHREAVRHLSSRVREASPDGENILRTAAEDEVVASLLSLHGLHPLTVESRVRRALGKVRAAEDGRAGRVEVLSIDRAAIRLRVDGSDRLRRAIERAVADAAPDVERVDIVGPDRDLVPVERLRGSRRGVHERCDLCGDGLASEHAHLFDVQRRRLSCACPACGVLFSSNAKNLRPVHRKAHRLYDVSITDAQWEALRVPVGLAFFSWSSALGAVVAAYPGPAGAIEFTTPPAAWEALVQANAALAALEPDTQALLVHRQGATARYYIVSIDACYRLTGLVRSRWQGLTGGNGPVQAIEEFFSALTEERS
jgi:uncharacterized protein DUF5947